VVVVQLVFSKRIFQAEYETQLRGYVFGREKDGAGECLKAVIVAGTAVVVVVVVGVLVGLLDPVIVSKKDYLAVDNGLLPEHQRRAV
jgi:hypothetical protein